ncbi:bifunctional ligase/repressor BirA [Clostridia bacterium]|nr:bifunctional ligase/repressor BirA [Clostridia bacterium]
MKYQILDIIKNAGEYVSGEELSRILGITRSAIWKNIGLLRDEGYVIDSVTNKGYRLQSTADALNESEIEKVLNTHTIGQKIIYFSSIDSTNAEVKRIAVKGAEHGTVVIAGEQTLGKGRFGREWSSPKGTGIWLSVLLRTDMSPANISGITLAAGLGICKAIRSLTGCNAQIKWPNDIIIGNKKICGILTEMTAEADRINYAVLGVGINVNTAEFPVEIEHKATSLMLATGRKVPRLNLLSEILQQLEIELDEYLLNPQNDLISQYRRLCATIGREVAVSRNNTNLQGKAVNIDNNGELVVKLADGKQISVSSGEVTVQGIY